MFVANVKDVDDPITLGNPIIEEKQGLESASSSNLGAVDEEYTRPTEEEQSILRKIPGKIPVVAYLLCLVELAERASYYGAKGPFNNFL